VNHFGGKIEQQVGKELTQKDTLMIKVYKRGRISRRLGKRRRQRLKSMKEDSPPRPRKIRQGKKDVRSEEQNFRNPKLQKKLCGANIKRESKGIK